jgi:cytoskeletal protein CcmA (bactofilin family)
MLLFTAPAYLATCENCCVSQNTAFPAVTAHAIAGFLQEAYMADDNQNGCLIVGEGVKLSGSFVVPNSASISGTIEGDLTAREILVGSTGILKGKITADLVDVRGEVHENITSNKALFVRATGKVTGTIQYAEIEIEKGGDLQGNLSKIDSGHSAT